MENCVFCQIIKGQRDAEKIWEDERFFVFLDQKPVNPGHLLIIPKFHVGYIFDVEEPLYTDLFQVAKRLSSPLKKATQAVRIALAVEGFGVDHVHLHLVPVNAGGELDPHRSMRATDQELADMAQAIKVQLATL